MTTPTTQREADERKLFEADMRVHGYTDNDLIRDSAGWYKDQRVADKWIGWQASAAIDRSPSPAPAASVSDVCAEMRALCSACGGTGDVHSIDGEWRGSCDCEASAPVAAPEAQVAAIIDKGLSWADATLTKYGLTLPAHTKLYACTGAAPEAPTLLLSDDDYCALEYAEKALRAIANREEVVSDVIEPLNDIRKASQRAKHALARLEPVLRHIFASDRASTGAAPEAPDSEQQGQWVRCTPALINAGVSCANTPRHPGDGTYSHDHFITPAATTASASECRKLGGTCWCQFGQCANGLDQPTTAYGTGRAPAPSRNAAPLEDLLGQYWEIAYSEGKTGESRGSEAQAVLSKIRAALTQQSAAQAPATWISTADQMPASGQRVIFGWVNALGKWRTSMGNWNARFTHESTNIDEDACEYNEADDTYYLLEGWNEWGWELEFSAYVSEPVTYWAPLPPAPEQTSTAGAAKGGITNTDDSSKNLAAMSAATEQKEKP